ncbi:hypothetical protein [Candidatus Phytoplasma pruni]|uniref:Uncharacterized protein n=1 Tax=Candidatus Phytoplasma pruni TaxID=479893 RepID=A0A851HD41_9MOLU|nr:hypothetical protein [Candidatus Phytoplasma pruni]NWN46001.1 hypothetical protein [Candidatus Phytoplasma pruni]
MAVKKTVETEKEKKTSSVKKEEVKKTRKAPVKKAAPVENNDKTKNNEKTTYQNWLKVLFINLVVTPLVFLMMVFLTNELLNILASFKIIEKPEKFLNSFSSLFNDLLLQNMEYNQGLRSKDIYILFYRWIFIVYMMFVIVYNVRFVLRISKKEKSLQLTK